MPNDSLDAAYFQRVYADTEDPWNFATSPYEARKYAQTLAELGSARYARALEIGCSIGFFTRMLAGHCDELLSIDINDRALALARERCAAAKNVRFSRMTVPQEFPGGAFDLVVLSEVGYYWSDDDLSLVKDRIVQGARGGTLELVHYLPKVDDYVRDGDAVHESFLQDGRFEPVRARRARSYRIDVVRIR